MCFPSSFSFELAKRILVYARISVLAHRQHDGDDNDMQYASPPFNRRFVDEHIGIWVARQLFDCKSGGSAAVSICYRFLRILRLADLRLLKGIYCVSLM